MLTILCPCFTTPAASDHKGNCQRLFSCVAACERTTILEQQRCVGGGYGQAHRVQGGAALQTEPPSQPAGEVRSCVSPHLHDSDAGGNRAVLSWLHPLTVKCQNKGLQHKKIIITDFPSQLSVNIIVQDLYFLASNEKKRLLGFCVTSLAIL